MEDNYGIFEYNYNKKFTQVRLAVTAYREVAAHKSEKKGAKKTKYHTIHNKSKSRKASSDEAKEQTEDAASEQVPRISFLDFNTQKSLENHLSSDKNPFEHRKLTLHISNSEDNLDQKSDRSSNDHSDGGSEQDLSEPTTKNPYFASLTKAKSFFSTIRYRITAMSIKINQFITEDNQLIL